MVQLSHVVRSHSHLGCQSCRQRKVKCDELKPSCRRCVRRRERCTYLDVFRANPDRSSPVRGEIMLAPFGMQERTVLKAMSPHLFNPMDSELVHHFLSWTCSTIWHRATGRKVWGEVIFRAALEHPPLMSGILATAAVHKITLLRDLDAVARYTEVALKRRADAFSGFKLLLNNPAPDKTLAIFALTALLMIWAYASSSLPINLDLLESSNDSLKTSLGTVQRRYSPLSRFLTLIKKASGTTAVMRQTRSHLENTAVGELVARPNVNSHSELPSGADKALQQLYSRLQDEPSIHIMFGSSCTYVPLRALLCVLSCPEDFNILIVWPLTLPQTFIESLSSRHPGALTVLAYWVACLHTYDNWWTNGWGYDLVYEIADIVDSSWIQLLEWPKSVVNTDEKLALISYHDDR